MPWLAENITVKLTELEAGWLLAKLLLIVNENPEEWPINKRGPNDESIPTTMPRLLADKIETAYLVSRNSR